MKVLLAIVFASMLAFAANAQDSPYRKEIKRADLTGTNMEVITSIVELNPGESSTLHIHHGEESFYVLDGGTIERADGKQVPFPTGFSGINARDVERTARRAGPVLHNLPRRFLIATGTELWFIVSSMTPFLLLMATYTPIQFSSGPYPIR